MADEWVLADSKIFIALCMVRYGEAWTTLDGSILRNVTAIQRQAEPSDLGRVLRDRFFEDIQRHRAALARKRKQTVSRQALLLWQRGASPRRLSALYFIQDYSHTVRKESEKANNWNDVKQMAYTWVENWLSDEMSTAGKSAQSRARSSLTNTNTNLLIGVRGLLAASEASSQSEYAGFFQNNRIADVANQSYYLAFRYSTSSNDIVKSFLVVKPPIKPLESQFTYTHFVWSGEDRGHLSHIFMENEGVIFKMEKSYYLVGYNYVVSADKRVAPDVYDEVRSKARWQPNGLVVLAAEYDDIRKSPGLFGALTLTLGDLGQPVIARVALLHLGTRQSLSCVIRDVDVQPGEIKRSVLDVDLKKTADKLDGLGCRNYGIALKDCLKDPDWATHGCNLLADRIRELIDNTPAWEIKKRRNQIPKKAPLNTCGAIETIGPDRPRS